MLLSEKLIDILKLHLKLQNAIGTSPFLTPRGGTNESFRLEAKPSSKVQAQKWRLLPGIALVAILYSQLYLNKGRTSNVTNFESSMYCISELAILIIKWVTISRVPQFVEQFNCLIVHELNYVPKGIHRRILSSTHGLLIKLVQICGIITGIVLPFAYGFMQIAIPCSPATFAYFFNSDCSHLVNFSNRILQAVNKLPLPVLVFRLSAASLTFWILSDTVGMFGFVVGQCLFTESCLIVYYLRAFRLQIAAQVRAKSIKHKILTIYRQLQIHNLFFNKINQDVIVITVIGNMVYSFTIAMYALLKFTDHVSLPQLVIFGNITLACFIVIIVVYGIFAKVNETSIKVLAYIREYVLPEINGSNLERKWLKRYVKSLSPLKVQIGQVNHVDNFTPLVMLQFCVGQICNLMVM